MTGRLVREPQSVERPKPSATPVLVALVLVVLCVLLPYLLMSLGYVAVGLILLILVSHKFHLGWGLRGLGSRGNSKEKPRILVSNFRIGVPKPDDARAVGAEYSCRLLTRQVDGAVELAGGDTVKITGWISGGQLIRVNAITVESTQGSLRAAPGAAPAPVAITSVLLLALAAGALWLNRAWLAPDVLTQAVLVIKQSIVQLVTLMVVLFITWVVIKKVILRR